MDGKIDFNELSNEGLRSFENGKMDFNELSNEGLKQFAKMFF